MVERRCVSACRAEGREIRGVVMPYGERAGDRAERFEPGSLLPDGDVWLDLDHDQTRVVAWMGAGLTFENTPEALTLRAALPRIPAADLALAGVRSGRRAGLSVEFDALQESRDGDMRVIELARLLGVGLVRSASYTAARVTELRQGGVSIEGSVPLGEKLACQCRDGCDSVELAPSAFDEALAEVSAGAREISVFTSGRYGQPIATSSGGATFRRAADELVFSTGPLDASLPVVRETLAAHRAGSARLVGRPYIRDAGSDVEKVGTLAIVHRADFRALEIATLTGPVSGLLPIRVIEPPAPAPAPGPPVRSRRLLWL